MRSNLLDHVVYKERHSAMSCSVCAGYIEHCPCCGEPARTIRCPKCQGSGYTPYMAFDIITRKDIPVTELAYAVLPPDEDTADSLGMRYCKQEIDICPLCNGAGEIPE